MRKILITIFTLGLLSLSTNNFAYYLGLGVGSSKIKPIVHGANFKVVDDRGLAKHIFIGQKINANFSVELGYAHLGSSAVEDNGVTENVIYRQVTAGLLYYPNIETQALGDVFIEGGLRHSNINPRERIDDKTGAYLGIGTDISIDDAQSVDLRLSFRSYSIDSKALLVSIIKKF